MVHGFPSVCLSRSIPTTRVKIPRMAHLKDLVNSDGFGRPFIDSGGAFGLNRLCEDDIPGYSSPPTVCNLAPVASVRGFSSMRVLRHWSALLRSSDIATNFSTA
jgi:hypothetical protein